MHRNDATCSETHKYFCQLGRDEVHRNASQECKNERRQWGIFEENRVLSHVWLAGWFLAGREEQKKKMIALSNYEVFFSSFGDSTDKRRMDPVKSARRNFEECNSIGFVVVQLQKLMSPSQNLRICLCSYNSHLIACSGKEE